MPNNPIMKLSKQKRDKIAEQILSLLYHNFPVAHFTATISKEIARDEEFVKQLMLELVDKKLVNCIRKNPDGISYSRRCRWSLSPNAYDAYKRAV
jgi:predicted transcriptional regulator with HTH domain